MSYSASESGGKITNSLSVSTKLISPLSFKVTKMQSSCALKKLRDILKQFTYRKDFQKKMKFKYIETREGMFASMNFKIQTA